MPRYENICARCKRTGRIFAFLRRHRHELFPKDFQTELAKIYADTPKGKPPVPHAGGTSRCYTGRQEHSRDSAAIGVPIDGSAKIGADQRVRKNTEVARTPITWQNRRMGTPWVNKNLLWLPLASGMAVALASIEACNSEDGEDLCGPCGSVLTGDISIAKDMRLDGMFMALSTMNASIDDATLDFNSDIADIAAVYGVLEAGTRVSVDEAFVSSLVEAIQADLLAHTTGGILVTYSPSNCFAPATTAFHAQATCEEDAGCECDRNEDLENIPLECDGVCIGYCTSDCDNVECISQPSGTPCPTVCKGACQLDSGGTCVGTCHGTCSANCSLITTEGVCQGICTGTCQGTCEMSEGEICDGTCHGTCNGDFDPSTCQGSLLCNDYCRGACLGECMGSYTPPTTRVDCTCDTTNDCKPQARLRAEANMSCTLPTLDLEFNTLGSLDAADLAAFLARTQKLRLHATNILQGTARVSALGTGDVNASHVFDPPPTLAIQEVFQELHFLSTTDLVEDSGYNIPVANAACVPPAVDEGYILAYELHYKTQSLLQAQLIFHKFILNPEGLLG